MPLPSDLAYAIRSLRRAKWLSTTLLATVAVGVGGSVALYSAADALLFRAPGGVRSPSELVEIYTSRFNGSTYGRFSYADFADLKASARSFQGLAAYDEGPSSTLRLADLSTTGRYAAVSAEFFDVLALDAVAGSLLLSDCQTPRPCAVINFDLWRAAGGNVAVLGQALTLNEIDYRVVGVTPAGFTGLHIGSTPSVWILLPAELTSGPRGDRRLAVLGRLRKDVSLEAAQMEVRDLGYTLAIRYPESNRGTQDEPDEPRRFTVVHYSWLEPAAKPHAVLVGAVLLTATGLGLLSACVNIGSLLLARAVARRREFAVKLALGASRSRLIRGVLFECVVLSLLGSVCGLVVAYWTSGTLTAMTSPEEHTLLQMRPTLATTARVLLAAIGAGVVVGLIPATGATRLSVSGSLRSHGGALDQSAGGMLRLFVLAAQVMLSTVLLVGTVSLIGAFSHATRAEFSFAPAKVAVVKIQSSGGFSNVVQGTRYHAAAMHELGAMDGVSSVAAATTLPMSRMARRWFELRDAGRQMTEAVEAEINYVSTDYFRTLSVPVIEGRNFEFRDDARDARAILVNEAFAQRFLGKNPIGRELQDSSHRTFDVVGVVRNEVYRTLQGSAEPRVYYPIHHDYSPRVHLIARTSGNARSYLARFQQRLAVLDEGGVVVGATSFGVYLSAALREERVATFLVGACGVSALCLTLVGVYSISVDAVRRRRREIGIRSALGASAVEIVRLVSVTAVGVGAAGAIAGLGAAFVMLRVVRWVAFLPTANLGTIIVSAAVLVAVVGAAAVLPAWRAAQGSAWTALRAE